MAKEIPVPNLKIDVEGLKHMAKCVKERNKFVPLSISTAYGIPAIKKAADKLQSIQTLNIMSDVFGKRDSYYVKPLLMTEEEKRPKINLKLKEDNTIKLITKRIEYNVSTGDTFSFGVAGASVSAGDTLTVNLGGEVEPWSMNYTNPMEDLGSMTFENESDITLKLK